MTITLTNGVFDSTGTNTLTNATSNTDYAIHGVPPTDDGAPYKISGTFTLKAGSGSVWPASINLYTYSEGAQRMAGALGPVSTEQTINGSFSDPDSRSTVFLPIVKTTAVQFVKKGEKFTDQWNFGTQPDAKGLDNGWYQSPTSGNYAQIPPADAVIYGPFKEQPAEAPDAPCRSSGRGSREHDHGPEDRSDQALHGDVGRGGEGVRLLRVADLDHRRKVKDLFKPLIPSPYSWKDAFGQTVESSIVPMTITGSTKVTTPEVALSGVPRRLGLDRERRDLAAERRQEHRRHREMGRVLGQDDRRPPSRCRRRRSPADAVKLGTVTQKVNKPGDIKTPDTAEALGFTAPAAGTGSIVWVLHIDAADNAGMVEDWSDDYGVPSEIQKIAQPTTKTQATPGAKPGTDTKDTAEVDGTLPANGGRAHVPAVRGTDGEGHLRQVGHQRPPKGTAAGDLSWVCTADNEKYSNVGKGQVIVKTGKYDSPEREDHRGQEVPVGGEAVVRAGQARRQAAADR